MPPDEKVLHDAFARIAGDPQQCRSQTQIISYFYPANYFSFLGKFDLIYYRDGKIFYRNEKLQGRFGMPGENKSKTQLGVHCFEFALRLTPRMLAR
jgi:hypothetical protein